MALSFVTEDSFEPSGHTFLVTGGAGFIGSHIVKQLVARGGQVRVLDAFTTGSRANLAQVASRIELIEGDLRDAGLVRQAAQAMYSTWLRWYRYPSQ